ncbi:MAG: SDR family oxidoreductase, partial [Opitutales bacterium]
VINRNAPLTALSDEEVSKVLDVNVKGLASVMRHFLPAMEDRGQGVVVNFSSGWGRSTSPEVAPYCASKWAVEGLSQAVAQEVGDGVAVVALNPGIIDTDMLRSCFGDSAASYPNAEAWATRAIPFLEGLGASNNGQSLTSP